MFQNDTQTDPLEEAFKKLQEAKKKASSKDNQTGQRDYYSDFFKTEEPTQQQNQGAQGGVLPKSPKMPQSQLPTQKPETLPQEQASYSFQGKPINRSQAMDIISQAQSAEDLNGLDVSNDPEVMQGLQARMQGQQTATGQTPGESPTNPRQIPDQSIDKPWWEDFMDGVAVGWDHMKGGAAYGIQQMTDMAPSIAATAPTIGEIPGSPGERKFEDFGVEYRKELAKQASGESKPALPGIKAFAERELEKAKLRGDTSDQDSWGFFIGNLIPQTAGIATAIGVGAVNPPAGMALGMANMGGLTTMAMGMAGNEYDEYVKEKGIPSNPNDKLAVMLLSGAVESGSEAIPVAKFIPKSVQGKLAKTIFGSTENLTKQAKELFEEFIQQKKGLAPRIKDLATSVGEGMLIEGSTEGFAELGGVFSTWLYKEKEDRETWKEIAQATWHGFLGGAIMGGMLGPLSYGAQQAQHTRRRKQSGRVVLAQNNNTGETLEIAGISNAKKKPDEGGLQDPEGLLNQEIRYEAVRPNGKIVEVSENEIGEIYELPYEIFNNLLKGKIKGQQAQEAQVNQEIAQEAQAEIDEFRAQFEGALFTDPTGREFLSVGLVNGKEHFVVGKVTQGLVVQPTEGGKREIVGQDKISDMKTVPFDEFMEQAGPVPQNTVAPFDPANPVQKGEIITIPLTPEMEAMGFDDSGNWVVSGMNLEEGWVNIEGEDGTPNQSKFHTLDLDVFQQLRKPVEENMEARAEPSEKSGGEKLRDIFMPGDKVDLSVDQKQDETPEAKPDNEPEGQGGHELGGQEQVTPIDGQQEEGPIEGTDNKVPVSDQEQQPNQQQNELQQAEQDQESRQEIGQEPKNQDKQATTVKEGQSNEEIKADEKQVTDADTGSKKTSTPDGPADQGPATGSTDVESPTSQIGFTVFGQFLTGKWNQDGSVTATDGTTYQRSMIDNVTEINQENDEKIQQYNRLKEKQAESGQTGPVDAGTNEGTLEKEAGQGVVGDAGPAVDAGGGQPDTASPGDSKRAQPKSKRSKSTDGISETEVRLQQQLDDLIEKIALKAKSPLAFMEKVRKIKNISPKLSKFFMDKYGSQTTGESTPLSAAIAYLSEKNPKMIDKWNQEFEDRKNRQVKLSDELEAKSKTGKEESRIETEQLNRKFEERAYEGLNEQERFEAVIEDKLATQQKLTKKELEWVNENLFLPKGYKLDQDGGLVKDQSNADYPVIKDGKATFKGYTFNLDENNIIIPDADFIVGLPISEQREYTKIALELSEILNPKKPNQSKVIKEDINIDLDNPSKMRRIVTLFESKPKDYDWSDSAIKKYNQAKERLGNLDSQQFPISQETPTNQEKTPEQLGIKQSPEKTTTENEDKADQSSLKGEDLSNEGEWSETQQQEQDKMIQDFGEKIGGARKDESTKGFKRGKKGDDGPAWAKKFKVFEMSDGTFDVAITKGQFFRTIKKGFKTEQDAYDAIPVMEAASNHRVYKKSEDNFAIYRVWKSGKHFDIKDGFKTKEEASIYLATNPIEFIEWKAPEIERPHLDSVQRKGPDYRKGKNATPKMFQETFGFRGGEFGNWVRGDERQKFLNFAYDGLMDLSRILNVPAKSLSLDGNLAIAFGSRGSGLGSASAHYERTRLVINLTKIKGAGSLAHEWFHAFDHYLGMLDGKASKEWNEDGKTIKAKTRDNDYLSHSHSLRSKIRPELLNKFMEFRDSMFKKEVEREMDISKQQKTLDRSVEYLEKGLEQIRKILTDPPSEYGRKKKPTTPEQLEKFEKLAEKILKGEIGKENWVQAPRSKWKGGYEFETETELKALYKEAKGRKLSDYYNIHQDIKRHELAKEALKEAKKGTTYTVKADTDFFSEAKKIDQTRATPYWSTPHEMAARAFESYIEDQISQQGESTYLVFGSDNKFYRMFDLKPYPEGQERIDINNQIKEVFEEIKVDESSPTKPLFKKSPPQPKTTPKQRKVQRMADEAVAGWKDKPEVIAFNNEQELKDHFNDPSLNKKDLTNVQAMVYTDPQTGQVTVAILADNPLNGYPETLKKTIVHEVVGHYGVRKFILEKLGTKDKAEFTKAFNEILDGIIADRWADPLMNSLSQDYFGKPFHELSLAQMREMAEEYIAHRSETETGGLWDKMVSFVREWMRKAGISLKYSDAEIRNLIANGYKIVQGGILSGQVKPGVFMANEPMSLAKMTEEQMRLEVIDGFYSPIEKRIREFKQPKASANKWKEIVGKKDEAQWTGVFQYLDGLKPDQQVTKEELMGWMKENRVRIEVKELGGFDDGNIASWWNDEGGANEETDFNDLSDSEKREARERYQEEIGDFDGTDTKFSEHQLPGEKSDYKEVLVTLPQKKTTKPYEQWLKENFYGEDRKEARDLYAQQIDSKDPNFKSSHFDEPNILVHLRMNTRTDANGDKVLFLEEIQSDWGQQGKRQGFKKPGFNWDTQLGKDAVAAIKDMDNFGYDSWQQAATALEKSNDILNDFDIDFKYKDLMLEYHDAVNQQRKTPPAPFVTDTNSWIKLGLKTTMQEAVRTEANKIAWTTGEQQNDRYDLSKQVDKIRYEKIDWSSGDVYNIYADRAGESVIAKYGRTPIQLEEIVGKDITQKIISGEGKDNSKGEKELSGLDLKVGGTGMKSFYGSPESGDIGMVGRVMESLVGKGSVEASTIGDSQQPSITITPEVTGQVTKGLPLFKKSQDPTTNPDIRFKVTPTNAELSERANETQKQGVSTWEKFTTANVDYMIPARKMVEKVLGNRELSDAQDFVTKENLAKSKARHYTTIFLDKIYNPILQEAKKINDTHGINQEGISDYLQARHHKERKERIIQNHLDDFTKKMKSKYSSDKELQKKYTSEEWVKKIKSDFDKKISKLDEKWPTGFTDQEAQDIIADFEDKVSFKERNNLINLVQQASQFVNDRRHEAGIISDEVYSQLNLMYNDYVPLRGYEELIGEDKTMFSPLMAAHGRTSKAASPIPYLFTAAQEAIIRGQNNIVRQSVLEFVKEFPSKGDFNIRNAWYVKTGKVDEDGNPVWIEQTERPTKEQIKSGDAVKSVDPLIQKKVNLSERNDNTIPLYVKGRRVFIDFSDKRIAMAIKNTSMDNLNTVMKNWNKVTRTISSMHTEYSPEFGPVNLIRDVGFGTFNIIVEKDAKLALQTLKKLNKSRGTLWDYFKNGEVDTKTEDGKLLQEWLEEGGLIGLNITKDASQLFEEAKNAIEQQGKTIGDVINFAKENPTKDGIKNAANFTYQNTKDFIKDNPAMKWLSAYNKTLENAMRFSHYKAMIEQGSTKQQAAIAAKDLTVNFDRKGNSTSFIASMFMFYNAQIQGIERMARNITNKKARGRMLKGLGTVMAAGMTQGILNGLFGGDDDDTERMYAKIPDYVRRTNIVLPFPGKGDYLLIPLPYGVNAFYTLGESIGSVLTGMKEPSGEALGVLTAFSDSFTPLGGFDFESEESTLGKIFGFLTPSIAKPLLEYEMNRNFFGSQIRKENFTPNQYKKPPSEMYFPGVSPLYRVPTDFLNKATGGDKVEPGEISWNPEFFEHAVDSYLGGPTKFGNRVLSTLETTISGKNPLSDPYYRKFPFLRRFVTKAGTQYDAQQTFYDHWREIDHLNQKLRDYKKQEPGKAHKFHTENRKILSLTDFAKTTKDQIDRVTDEINRLKQSDSKEAKDRIEQLYDSRAKIMKGFNRVYNSRKD